jgi:hypothetical protein
LAVIALLGACSSKSDNVRATADVPAQMPLARTEVAGTQWLADRIVVLGGLTKDGLASARADMYRPASNRWTRLPDMPVALHHTAAVEFLARVFVVGGYTIANGQWTESARVISLGPNEKTWREESPLPAARGAHAAVPLRNHIVVVGGVSQGKVAATTAVYTPETGWAAGPEMQRPREHLAAAVAQDRVYAIGGRADGVNFRDVESWDGRASHWWNEPSLNDSRGGIGAATLAGIPCVAGGEETAGTIASVECLRRGMWRRAATLKVPRHGLAVVALQDKLHVIGGGPQPGLFVSRAHEVLRPLASG